MKTELLGPAHYSTLTTRNELARGVFILGRYSFRVEYSKLVLIHVNCRYPEAFQMQQEILELGESQQSDHKNKSLLGIVLNNMAISLVRMVCSPVTD